MREDVFSLEQKERDALLGQQVGARHVPPNRLVRSMLKVVMKADSAT